MGLRTLMSGAIAMAAIILAVAQNCSYTEEASGDGCRRAFFAC
jgi:hypothetical protein